MSEPVKNSLEPTSQTVANGLVAVVVVGHNEKHLLGACFSSWNRVTYEPVQLIYVDNDSTDCTIEFLQAEFPRVKAVSSGGNLGYCGGNNVGIRMALDGDAEFVLILNPDTTVYDGAFVSSLVNYLRDHPRVGKVGPRVFLRKAGVVQNTILSWPSIGGSVFARFRRRNQSATMQEAGEVDVLNGCCVLVRAVTIRDVGLYDEEYWCYGDEAEWDWRAKQVGWERHFVPVDSIIHHQKLVGYDLSSRSNFLMKRNAALWFLNARKPLSLLAWIAATSAIAIWRIIMAPFRGQSVVKYSQFAAKLAQAYAEILWRLITGNKRAKDSLSTGIRCLPKC